MPSFGIPSINNPFQDKLRRLLDIKALKLNIPKIGL